MGDREFPGVFAMQMSNRERNRVRLEQVDPHRSWRPNHHDRCEQPV